VLVYILGIISVICMVSGAVVARFSDRSPSYARSMEILFGGLVMSGLGMLDILIVVGP
jgi:threonine/homoserine/homoserine lactone efflux protein